MLHLNEYLILILLNKTAEETCGGPLTATSVPQLLSFHNCSSSCDWLLTATTDGSLVTVAFSEILSDDCSKPQITVTDAVTGESLPIE